MLSHIRGCMHDPYISCRSGIGTRSGGNTTPESGNQKTPVSDLIGAMNQNHFSATYHFQIDPSIPSNIIPLSYTS
jgi:hypothetical protein